MTRQQDLHDARALLEQSGTQDQQKKYRKAAEIILLKAVSRDPEDREARALLQSVRSMAALAEKHSWPKTPDDVPFVVAPSVQASSVQHKEKKKRTWWKLPFVVIAIVVLAGGLQLILRSGPVDSKTLAVPVTLAESFVTPEVVAPAPSVVAQPPLALLPDPPAQAADPIVVPSPERVFTVTPPITVTAAPVTVAVAPAMGKFAVSSPTSADIYMDDRYLGSTPTTLSLPVGTHTLEYRHGDLRTVVSHEIRSAETTTASVTFEITVPINANPWAQVFLDGPTRRPLGQTPLSGVSVPIGGVLIFENPKFGLKRYRVTERSAAIQVNFP